MNLIWRNNFGAAVSDKDMGTGIRKSANVGDSAGAVSPVSDRARAGTASRFELATFGAGPFWSVEPLFKFLPGVLETTVGYAGGNLPSPTFLDVFSEQSGHAEVVQLRYDCSRLNYSELLETFWSCHDPTQLNRQGPDIGMQFRSVIFCHNGVQAMLARRSRDIREQSRAFSRPIVTQIELLQHFWPADVELQDDLCDLEEKALEALPNPKIRRPCPGS